ncbi:sensor histidine kinase [Dyella sp. A6]|uniref:sensor histidine kinase n=1 Tax=Dyella aluminiiresistens TaxID=3069105 RepID=UPI002E76F39A|nr:ATP-binding protein [Dyella sp. A6]
MTRLSWRLGLLLCGLLVCLGLHAQPQPGAVATLVRAEAVATGWYADAPPATGWVKVTLPELWTRRWPHHDGVVWYRLRWNQASTDQPIGLLLDYVCLADAVWVNGSLVHRDAHLVEPLSRRWITPQYFMLDKPLLRNGENTLLVRVSGLADYQPGFGTVELGPPRLVGAMYRREMFSRFYIHLFNFAISLVLGVLFMMFWLLRRKESLFGWYALTTLLGAGYAWNFVASGTWPFASTDAWEAMVTAMFCASGTTFCIFLLRFCGLRWRRTEYTLLAAGAFALVAALVAPHIVGPWRNVLVLPAIALDYTSTVIFIVYAVRTPRVDVRVVAVCLLVPLLVSVLDLFSFMQWANSSNYDLVALTSPLTLVGMGFAVAWRFSQAMRRVEGFNAELLREIDTATAQLSETLSREHALALTNTRIAERLNLVRDLHDGFGGSLVGAIAELEQQSSPEAGRMVTRLKELRDDLRLVIDTTMHDAQADLGHLLAPLRHRWSQRLLLADIDSCWRVDGLDACYLGPARSLDFMRFLQEALTNVFKHSGASTVTIEARRCDGFLQIDVRDDGRGFEQGAGREGAGLASMKARGTRLGGHLTIETAARSGVSLQLSIPYNDGRTLPAEAGA